MQSAFARICPRITPVQHSESQAVDVIPDRFSMAKSNIQYSPPFNLINQV
jgi:hypothetical protein